MVHSRRFRAVTAGLSDNRSRWRSTRHPRRALFVLVSALSLVVSCLAVDVLLPHVAATAAVDPPGIISTVAGTGINGFSGDGGPAATAQLNYPNDVVADASGNIFIADYNNNRIRRVSPSGVITTVAGNGSPGFSGDGGPATDASLNAPVGVAVDPPATSSSLSWLTIEFVR